MLRNDKLKLKIIELVRRKGELTISQVQRGVKAASFYRVKNALEFLEAIGVVQIKEKKDKLGSKMVRLSK